MENSYYEYSRNDKRPFEMWMKFAIALANYIKEHERKLKIYISLPEKELFLQFFIFGCVDYDIRSGISVFNKERVNDLSEKDIIYYFGNGKWENKIFITLKYNEDNKRQIEIKDFGRLRYEVPEHLWETFLRIPNKQKNVSNTETLQKIYGPDLMQKAITLGVPLTYLATTKTQWYKNIEDLILHLNGVRITGSDIFKSENNYYNNLFLLTNQKNIIINKSSQSIIVCDGTLKVLQYMSMYKNEKHIYIVDRMESSERLDVVKHSFQNTVLVEALQNKNIDFLNYLQRKKITVPQGVELFIAAQDE